PLEQEIAAIWSEVLGIERIGVHENFFELGGHSLLATRVMARLREVLGVQVPLRSLFESGTVADLAIEVARRKSDRPEGQVDIHLPSLLPDRLRRHEPFPLNDVQLAYWVGRSGALELGNVSTHTYFEFENTGLDMERLSRALDLLIQRHDMLRAIVLPDGQQRVLARVPSYQIAVLDLRQRDPHDIDAALNAIRNEMSHQILPADRWPLFEVRGCLLSPDRVRLHVSVDILLMDAWSSWIILRELGQLYLDIDAGLDPLPVTFRDYILAEAAMEETEEYRRSRDYWFARLPTLPPAPELPLIQDPAALLDPRFSRRSARLTAPRWSVLKRAARSKGLTPSGLLLAAFAEVLAAWSKTPQFTLNITTFNRLPLHPQVDQLVGDFTSLTLVEVDASRAATFELRARQVQEQLWEDLEHRFFSGVRVLRELARSQGRMPGALMPVVFTSLLFGSRDGEPVELVEEEPEAEQESAFAITQTPQVWLDHQVTEQSSGGLVFHWDAVEDLFPAGLLDAMFAAYCGLLRRLSEEEPAWSAAVSGLLPQSHLELQSAANATSREIPEGLLHAAVAARARLHPERLAVVCGGVEIRYGELWRQANQIGHRLRRLGAAPNHLVGVVMEKGWEQVVGVLGVLVSGAAYLPIDADLPRERLTHLLERGEVRWVLTQASVDGRVDWPEGVLRLVVGGEDLAGEPGSDLEPVQGAGDLAYVIFTSGSTGQPKGVMIDHRGALNTIVDVNARFLVGEGDRVLGLSSLSFDLSVYDIFGLLSVGGALVLPEPWAAREPSRWRELVEAYGVTVWNSVPALLEMFVENQGEVAVAAPLRLALLSGDWIPLRLPERIRALCPGVEVVSLGGATEASIWSILYRIEEVDAGWSSIPYGRPMVNQRFHVLGGDLEPRPLWVPGSLYIGGVGLALGYWRDEEKTSSSFVEHPRTGERLYRTGDLGRYLPGGEIEFLGREDFQVKVQGYRIELGEIESVLEQNPAVRAAVVTAVGAPRTNRRLVAYVVADRAAETKLMAPAGAAAIRPDLAPVPMLPAHAGQLEKLEFKLSEPGLRRGDGRRPAVDLTGNADLAELADVYLCRRSHREFQPEPVALSDLGDLLGSLLQIELEKLPFPKYRYPSAGNLYPVQAYLFVRPGGVAGLAAGIYYHHPREHRLVLLAEGDLIGRDIHYPVNQKSFESSAFSIFLVGRLAAIEPMYGPMALDYAMLEAGYMSQLLMTIAPEHALGLCPVGSLTGFDSLRERFGLDDGDVLLYSLLGGRPRQGSYTAAAEAPATGEGVAVPASGAVSGPQPPRGSAPRMPAGATLESELEQLELKLSQPGVRRDLVESPAVDLARPELDPELLRAYRRRASFRQLLSRPVPFSDLSRLLAALMPLELAALPLPKYRYPSAGDLHPVQVYAYVGPGRVEGLAGGLYYYHSKWHRLVLLDERELDADIHFPVNQGLFGQSAFSLFLIGRMSAIAPIYGERARAYSLLEAGAMCQLLMTVAPDLRLGLCPIGNLAFERIRARFDLHDDDVLLHSLVGGGIADDLAMVASTAGTGDDKAAPATAGAPTAADSAELLLDRLRAHLQEKLPAYMVPAHFVVLEQFPLSPNGKVDRRALPAVTFSSTDASTGYAAPRNALEEQLARIWESLLGVAQVGIHDNFFALGGDSVKGVQLLARARQLGVELSVRHLFERQTIAEIVATLRSEWVGDFASAGGPMPLLPGQYLWLAAGSEGNAHTLWLTLEPGIGLATIEAALANVIGHQEALGLLLERTAAGWQQAAAGRRPVLLEIDLSRCDPAARAGVAEAELRALAAGLGPAAGQLVGCVLFRLGAEARLGMALHGLVADGESLPILLAEIEAQLRGDIESRPGRFGRAVRQFTDRVLAEEVQEEIPFWLAQDAGHRLPLAVPAPGGEGESRGVEAVWLEPAETALLTGTVLATYRARLEEVLVAAVAGALAEWTGSRTVRLDILRRPLPEEVDRLDLSRLVGCFAAVFPLGLDLTAAANESELLGAVKETWRRIPAGGSGYGLLRHLHPDAGLVQRLSELPQSDVLFVASGAPSDPRIRACSAAGVNGYGLEIQARLEQERLVIEWAWNGVEGLREVAAGLGRAALATLRSLIAQSASADAARYLPTDFPIAGLNQEELDEIMESFGNDAD
ncbi:MAG TPA: amino acid adenylation domain-containing protein, partial [Thermoanaerobaculia bacterium]|nr:amino acid adenylation domain-containing protein [Thermoanaerobaculia bacterium]